jgi:hypothetical protein
MARSLNRHGGAAAVGSKVVAKLGYRAVHVYERQTAQATLVESSLPLTFGFLGPDDAAAYATHRPDLTPTTVAGYFASGDRCYAAWLDGQIVSSRWVALGPASIDSLDVSFELAAHQAYVHQAFTNAAVRGHRVSPATGTRLVAELASEGCAKAFGFVQAENLQGIRNAERAGYVRRETISDWGFGPLRIPLRRARLTRTGFARRRGLPVARKLETLKLLWSLGGPRAITRRVMAKLGYRSVMIYELALDRPPSPIEPRVPLTFRFLGADEIDAFQAHCPELERAKIEELLREGNRCFVGCREDEIVSSGWVQRGPAQIESLGVDLRLNSDQAYVHNGFTSAAHRGNRALPALGTRLANVLASEGCSVSIALVQGDNLSGVRNAEHIGHMKTGTLAEFALGPLHVPVSKTDVADARFSRAGHTAKYGS